MCLQVIRILQFDSSRSKWLDMLALAAMTAVYRAAFFGTLKLREARLPWCP